MADLSTGADAVGGERFGACEYNDIKNHWRMSDPCGSLTNIQPGMIVSDEDDEKLYHYQAAACQEIIQTATPISDDAQIIGGDGSDAILIPYEETTNDAVIWGIPTDPARGIIFCDVADVGANFTGLVPAMDVCISIIDKDVDSALHIGFIDDDIPHIDSNRDIRMQYEAQNDVTFFQNCGAGENRYVIIYGWSTGRGARQFTRFQMSDTNDEFLIEAENSGDHEGITIKFNEAGQRFRIRQGGDILSWYLDGTDAFVRWSDGQLEFQTDETNATTVLRIKPNGTSEVSQLDFYDADGIRLSLYTAADRAYIESVDGVLGINPNAAQDVYFFESATSGENPDVYIYGYITAGTAVRYGRFRMDDTNDEFLIEAENNANHEGITVNLLETNQRFRIRQNSDIVSLSHDGTDANLDWTGTDLNLLPPAGGAVVIDGGANNLRAGLDIINLGTATRGIDLSSTGLAGADALIYIDANNVWQANLTLMATNITIANQLTTPILETPTDGDFEVRTASGFGNFNFYFRSATGSAALFGDRRPEEANNCTSNGTATITKIGHGLTVNVGDLLHITDATTAADKGYYTIVATTINTFVVDRALAGSDGDVDVKIYNDVIGIFGTDGVNGQRIMNYSAQDKPLQIGGNTLQATTGMGSEDVALGGITGYVRQGLLLQWTYQGDVADDGIFNLPAFTDSCWGFIQAGNNEEYAMFTVDNVGDVTLISNSANVIANADIDGNLVLGTAATQEPLQIRNRLGATKNINLMIWYS